LELNRDTDNNNRVARAALLSAYRYRIGWEERAILGIAVVLLAVLKLRQDWKLSDAERAHHRGR
jgi:hypothetical protein